MQGLGTVIYHVTDLDRAKAWYAFAGGTLPAPIQDVGGGIKVAEVADPFGNTIGLIENPQFRLPQL